MNGRARPRTICGLPRRGAGAKLHPAAAKLGVSQSALSQTIRGLEARLGVRLLTRTTRSVAPTEAGERLLRTRRPALEEIEAELAALSELRESPPAPSGSPPREHAADTVLWPALAKLLPDYPDIKVEIVIDYGLTDIVAGALRRRRSLRRAGREGHGRRAHRAGHAHGGRRRAVLLRRPAAAEDAAGSRPATTASICACRPMAASTPGSSRRAAAS